MVSEYNPNIPITSVVSDGIEQHEVTLENQNIYVGDFKLAELAQPASAILAFSMNQPGRDIPAQEAKSSTGIRSGQIYVNLARKLSLSPMGIDRLNGLTLLSAVFSNKPSLDKDGMPLLRDFTGIRFNSFIDESAKAIAIDDLGVQGKHEIDESSDQDTGMDSERVNLDDSSSREQVRSMFNSRKNVNLVPLDGERAESFLLKTVMARPAGIEGSELLSLVVGQLKYDGKPHSEADAIHEIYKEYSQLESTNSLIALRQIVRDGKLLMIARRREKLVATGTHASMRYQLDENPSA